MTPYVYLRALSELASSYRNIVTAAERTSNNPDIALATRNAGDAIGGLAHKTIGDLMRTFHEDPQAKASADDLVTIAKAINDLSHSHMGHEAVLGLLGVVQWLPTRLELNPVVAVFPNPFDAGPERRDRSADVPADTLRVELEAVRQELATTNEQLRKRLEAAREELADERKAHELALSVMAELATTNEQLRKQLADKPAET